MNKRIWRDRYCGHEQKRYKTMRRVVSVPTLAAKEKKNVSPLLCFQCSNLYLFRRIETIACVGIAMASPRELKEKI